ncbi:trypsin-like serine peptidase [Tunturibacter empetritectus]|uniref:Peptidase S1 domain-containing protein n=1 Tax=Tunturiibacter empetritectus TaxID=3069691 RepID=A0A7W8IHR7_9BACT|nr:trypsin-like serine protease [Edaphobacter lichenicola]MBB5317390.1 hypothetical protein [Edaphobacter lichenicola]
MSAKSRVARKQTTSKPPLSADQILRLDNIYKHKPSPKELHSLKSSNTYTIPDAGSKFNLEKAIRQIRTKDGTVSWQVEGDVKIIRGKPIEKFHLLRPGEANEAPTLPLPPPGEGKRNSPTLPVPPPFRPEWADQIYHPKMVTRMPRPTMRRKNGDRVTPLYIWGQDARQPFFPSGYPLQCIGKLLIYTDPYSFVPSEFGTGALVGPDIVLTAAHCVPWNSNPAMIQFIPAYFEGVSTLGSNVSSYVVDASTYVDNLSNPAPAFDYAVLRLQDRLGDSLGYFGAKSYDTGWNDGNYWTLVGYPGDVAGAEQPSSQSGISFHDDDEDSNDHGDALELETENGDANHGDSGGPMFAFWDDGPYIVAVLVAEEEEYFFWPFTTELNNVASAGPAMIQLIQWARNTWG